MNNDPYDSFKRGIQNDIKGLAYSLFAQIGLFLLMLTIAGILMWFFLKANQYNTEVKTIVGVSILVLVVAMVSNKHIGNFIYLSWLKLLLLVVLLLCIGFLGFVVYAMYFILKGYF